MWVPVVGNDVATAVEAVTGVDVNDKLSQLSDEDDKLPSEPVTTIVFAELSNGCGGLELLLLLQLQLVLLLTLAVMPPSTPLPRSAVAVPDEDASLAAILVDDVAAAAPVPAAAAVGDGVAGTRAKFSGFICMEPKLIRCRLPVVCIRTRMGGWRQPRANRALRIIPRAPPTFCPA